MKTIIVKKLDGYIRVALNRVEQRNSINLLLMEELNEAFDEAERDPSCCAIILESGQDFFCAGMDLQEISSFFDQPSKVLLWTSQYMSLLKRLSAIPKLVISKVEGKVFAGGVGLVAASDFVFGTEKAQFKLTEALWGLLPAMVSPYLIRRCGFQKSYAMALTCQTLSAKEAHSMHLIDDLTQDLEGAIQKKIAEQKLISPRTMQEMKNYFRSLSLINDEIENAAIEKTTLLLQDPQIQAKIKDFVLHKKLPWTS